MIIFMRIKATTSNAFLAFTRAWNRLFYKDSYVYGGFIWVYLGFA